ncbi:hypothetical protein P4574_24620 [Priestia megaterium]|uniref:hypothetical protein n=1 Tax=Priestia megaterium TaxID=1404 RepID=UPI002E1E840A|nr:hypothetical protein [Priestia megaterium]
MEFETYLNEVYISKRTKTHLKKISAKQYNNRLENMKKKGIYNNEKVISEDIKNRISLHYANRRNEYVDTLKYYIEYMTHLEGLTQK